MDLEIERERKKQTKIKSLWFKKSKEKLMNAFGRFVVHNRLPFAVAESPWTRPLLRVASKVRSSIPPPTAYELAEVWLPREYQLMKEYIASFAGIWKERGVSILCDAWTGPTKMSIINFLVYSNRGTIFHKSVNAFDVEKKDGNYYFQLMSKVVEEVGVEKVVQIVTDNDAAIKSAGKMLMNKYHHLYWTSCSAHCIDLILEDIGKILGREVKKVTVLQKGRKSPNLYIILIG